MKTVIKVQRAMLGENRILIYNEDRSVFQEFENNAVLAFALGDQLKVYLEVTIDDAGLMTIHREVKATW